MRNKRRVSLTKAGHVFLDEARKLVVQAGHAREAARHAQKGDSGIVRIGIASGLGGMISRTVFEHRKQFPGIDTECKDIFSSFQNEALCKGEIDIGFLRPPIDQVHLDCEVLFEEEFVAVLPKSHRLAKRKSLRLTDIAEEPLVIFDRPFSTGLYDKVIGLYNRHGLTCHLTATHVQPHEEAGAIMVASGKGIFLGVGAIVNRSVSGIELVSVPLNEPEAKIELYVAWRKNEQSPAVFSFLDTARRVLRDQAARDIG
jgi:DNA-binding transcriptional LysR family regulator